MKRLIKFCLFLSVVSNAFALESSDVFKVSILKAYKNNYLVINRGLEDGIDKGDHIKLTNTQGYIARAICVKTSMLLSNWKVYRVVRPELLSFDSIYKLKSINQSKVPKQLSFLKKKDFSQKFNDFTDKNMKKEVKLQQERIASFDLPNDMKSDPMIAEAKKSGTDQFISKNFDAAQLGSDFEKFKISIYASPISWQFQNDQRDSNYGVNIENIGDKYDLAINYNKTDSVVVDPFTESEVSFSSSHTDLSFDIKNISENISYFSYVSSDQAKNGDINNPKQLTQLGFIGFKYHFIRPGEDDDIQLLDLSYITLLESLENDTYKLDNGTGTKVVDNQKLDNLRHAFRLRFHTKISEEITLSSVLWYKPYMYLDDKQIDWDDNKTDWTTTLNFGLAPKFSTEISYQYLYDITQFRDYEIDPMNQVTTINLRYDFTL